MIGSVEQLEREVLDKFCPSLRWQYDFYGLYSVNKHFNISEPRNDLFGLLFYCAAALIAARCLIYLLSVLKNGRPRKAKDNDQKPN